MGVDYTWFASDDEGRLYVMYGNKHGAFPKGAQLLEFGDIPTDVPWLREMSRSQFSNYPNICEFIDSYSHPNDPDRRDFYQLDDGQTLPIRRSHLSPAWQEVFSKHVLPLGPREVYLRRSSVPLTHPQWDSAHYEVEAPSTSRAPSPNDTELPVELQVLLDALPEPKKREAPPVTVVFDRADRVAVFRFPGTNPWSLVESFADSAMEFTPIAPWAPTSSSVLERSQRGTLCVSDLSPEVVARIQWHRFAGSLSDTTEMTPADLKPASHIP